ncbi:unnamed protein product [Pylaiella littoralis]
MVRYKGGRLVLAVLTVGMDCYARVGGTASTLAANGTCNVCRGVTQGIVDLHAEWPVVRKMGKVAATTLPLDGGAGTDGGAFGGDDAVPITYEAAIERFCEQSFLSSNQQRVCYSIAPFAAEVGKWLGLGVPPDRICRKLGKRNPETCFDAREAERPSDATDPLLDWRSRPPSIPDGVHCSIEHRNSLSPRWVLLD